MVATQTLELVDEARSRRLVTTVHAPARLEAPAPLVVFCHGWVGHPRKFAQLLGMWAEAGFVVAAPAFPLTNEDSDEQRVFEDVVNQPADVSFVVDAFLGSKDAPPVDPGRIAVAGFSLGGITALAATCHRAYRDRRFCAVASVSGGFWPPFGDVYEPPRIPVLLVHGTADDVAPYENSEAAYRSAGPPKILVSLPDAGHDVCQDSGLKTAVAETTLAFWQLYLAGNERARRRLVGPRQDAIVRPAGV